MSAAVTVELEIPICPVVGQYLEKYGFPHQVTSIDKLRARAHYEMMARELGRGEGGNDNA